MFSGGATPRACPWSTQCSRMQRDGRANRVMRIRVSSAQCDIHEQTRGAAPPLNIACGPNALLRTDASFSPPKAEALLTVFPFRPPIYSSCLILLLHPVIPLLSCRWESTLSCHRSRRDRYLNPGFPWKRWAGQGSCDRGAGRASGLRSSEPSIKMVSGN